MAEVIEHITVAEKVYKVIADALGIDEAEFEGDESLIDTYGAESIDFLDISFRLNKEFGVKLFRGNFLERAIEVLGDSVELIKDDCLTQAGVSLLQTRLPESKENPLLRVGMPKRLIQQLYCANTWVRLVAELIDEGNTTGEEYLMNWLEAYRKSLLSLE